MLEHENLPLTIEQVALITGVPKPTLRYWESVFGQFLRPARAPSRWRRYNRKDVAMVKTIKRLVEDEHLTAKGVRLRLEAGHGK